MTVGAYLGPIGGASPSTNNYLTPDQNGTAIPVYIYATVTGTNPVTTVPGTPQATQISVGNFNGLQYLYYNLLATGGNSSGIKGGITGETLNSVLGFDSSSTGNGVGITGTDPSGNASAGIASQLGTVQLAAGSNLAAATTVVAVGTPAALNTATPVSSSAMTDFAKPRAGGPVWSNFASYNSSTGYTYKNDGTNIIIGTGTNGLATNQVAFLVEKFNYTPSAFTPSTAANKVSTSFSVQAPFNGSTSLLASVSYAASNSFNDSGTTVYTYSSATGSSLAPITSSNYSSGHTALLTDTINGDANGDGQVGFSDLGLVLTHYGATDTKWGDGNFLFSTTANTVVGFGDLGLVLTNYGASLGSLPSTVVADSALLSDPQAVALLESVGVTPVSAVPEPVSLGAIGLLAVAGLRRRRR